MFPMGVSMVGLAIITVVFLSCTSINEVQAIPKCIRAGMNNGGFSEIIPTDTNYGIPNLDLTDKSILHCNGLIPTTIPENVNAVNLYNVTALFKDKSCLFCDASWGTVITLLIYEQNDGASLPNAFFTGLNKLEILHIQTRQILILNAQTFSGLKKVHTLRFHKCLRLLFSNVLDALKDEEMLPLLSHLSLEELSTYNEELHTKLNLDKEALDILSSRRPISDLHLSNIKFLIINLTVSSPLCNSLNLMNLSHSVYQLDLGKNVKCHSLRKLDLSYSETQKARKLDQDLNLTNSNYTLSSDDDTDLYTNITHLYLANVLKSTKNYHANLYNIAVDSDMTLSLKYADLSGNRVKHLDVSLNIKVEIEGIDLSRNEMEYISQRTLDSLAKFLTSLDLSHNVLFKMEQKTEFKFLFHKLVSLVVLDLSSNRLTRIPRRMFVENRNLETLDLSHNELAHLSLECSSLANLKLLDLKDNALMYLQPDTIDPLQAIFDKQEHATNHKQLLLVDLHVNPLSCVCKSLPFMSWITKSRIFQNIKNPDYYCEYIGGQELINEQLKESVEEELCPESQTQLESTLVCVVLYIVGFITLVNQIMNIIRALEIIQKCINLLAKVFT